MALVSNRLGDTLAAKARSKLGIRFGRFAVAAIAAFATTEVVLTICAGPLQLTATWASLIAWFSGALVSYVLSRWAWKRKGRPSLLKETLPFWVVSAMVVVILTLATKFAYHSAAWLGLSGAERVLYVDADLRRGQHRHVPAAVPVLPLRPLRRIRRPGRARCRRRGAGLDRPRARAVRPGRGVDRADARGARRRLRRSGVTLTRS